jgi:rfaE bifunctional protein kinase chain/domain
MPKPCLNTFWELESRNMTPQRFQAITSQYGRLRVGVAGDFCLDRYLELDGTREEMSIETGLVVHNVTGVRSQPGGAGTIVNNLAALGIGEIFPIGFAGDDGEGFELHRALAARRGVNLDYFLRTDQRRTFTYCKPMMHEPGKTPRELNRLDYKNWTPTPAALTERLVANLTRVAPELDVLILLGQVDEAETGVLTTGFLKAIGKLAASRPDFPIIADSRCGFGGFPPVIYKMNATEVTTLTKVSASAGVDEISTVTAKFAQRVGRPVIVTLAERGMLGALPDGTVNYVPSHPVHGEIDVVGAGDAVTANLATAMAVPATLGEALELAAAAASIVIHQLGTTGTASVAQIQKLLFNPHDVKAEFQKR